MPTPENALEIAQVHRQPSPRNEAANEVACYEDTRRRLTPSINPHD